MYVGQPWHLNQTGEELKKNAGGAFNTGIHVDTRWSQSVLLRMFFRVQINFLWHHRIRSVKLRVFVGALWLVPNSAHFLSQFSQWSGSGFSVGCSLVLFAKLLVRTWEPNTWLPQVWPFALGEAQFPFVTSQRAEREGGTGRIGVGRWGGGWPLSRPCMLVSGFDVVAD